MEDKLIDDEVLTELKGRMKDNRVIPGILPSHITIEDLRDIDPASYEACLVPTMTSTSVMPTTIGDKECFRTFMDALIIYVEDPTPDKATWVKTLQRGYNISVYITDYPEQFSARISISMQCGMWKTNQWDEMVPYAVSDIIREAVEHL